ncbi:MFS transporter [Shouchella sp. 1P09AA]|uniref:MFS transporter n=1 Tax=unclassified Shouchella TaxID=2893065 RepID=UPI00399FAB5D
MTKAIGDQPSYYHESKLWRIGLFALNNSATNIYLFILGFVAYYAAGIAGLTVVVTSTVITGSRIFDGFTDPIAGFILDKLETRFGKFRPFMVIGNVTLATSILLMYSLTHIVPSSYTLIVFIGCYILYILGYTLQTSVTKAGQTVLTNNPKQRPLFAMFDGIVTALLFGLGQLYVASYLMQKHGDFTIGLFTELNTIAVIVSAIFTILAVIGITPKDKKEYYGLADNTVETRFKDYWPILKSNKGFLMLIISVATDKLAFSILRYQVVVVMLFGIVMGDFAISGVVSAIVTIPNVVITIITVAFATKWGLKKALVMSTWAGLSAAISLVGLFLLIEDPTMLSFENIGIPMILFIVFYTILLGFGGNSSALVNPMIADVSDYETFRTGRYIPGMMGTIFSFIDKLITSLPALIVGITVSLIGFSDEFPTVNDTLTDALFYTTVVLAFVIPMLGFIVTLIAMKFYPLDKKKMEEVQAGILAMKQTNHSPDKEKNVF